MAERDDEREDEVGAEAAPRTWRRTALGAIVFVFLLSVGVRAMVGAPEPAAPPAARTAPPPGATGFVGEMPGEPSEPPGAESAPEPEPTGIERWLPYVTEGSLFALIGYALGASSRMAVKLGLILLAVAFVGLQALSMSGAVTVDWGRVVDLLNRLVLQVRENEPITALMRHKLPSAGSLAVGFALGYRRG